MKKLIYIPLLLILLQTHTSFAFTTIDSEKDYYEWLIVMGKPVTVWGIDGTTLKANYQVYVDYEQIAYGSHEDVPNNRTDRFNKWEFLGYAEDGITPVGNSRFEADAMSNTFPRNTNFIKVPNAQKSWENVDTAVIEWILTNPLMYEDAPYYGEITPEFYVEDISPNYTEYVKIISLPTWKTKGNLYTLNDGQKK